jgi:hypothetical protein
MDYIDRDHKPDLAGEHGALGHALLLTMNRWQCLARRGVSTNYIATAVLAARKKGDHDYMERLCCMEGGFVIPHRLGGQFGYNVGRCIRFSANEVLGLALSYYKEAIAIYIKTMRLGLERAITVRVNMSNNVGAVSLCCSPPRQDLQLLASPIPHVRPATRVAISQGELYKLEQITGSLETWLRDLEERRNLVAVFTQKPLDKGPFIVKVSCYTVHNALVHPVDFWYALLAIHSEGSRKLKSEISNSLVACAHVSRRCVVTVMKDLSLADGTVLAVSPALFETRLHLWDAFATLVRKVLIPMASLDIIHADIRFDPKSTCLYNVLATKNSKGAVKLRLIDFESLVDFNTGNRSPAKQDFAIYFSHFRVNGHLPAITFLFWQVLWAAYVWSPMRRGTLVTAGTFVRTFLAQVKSFQLFKSEIGNVNLTKIREAEHDHDVSKILRIIRDVFA